MTSMHRTLLALAVLAAAPLLHAAATESSITKELGSLRSLSETARPIATIKLAGDIQTLGLRDKNKVRSSPTASHTW